jgi:hypothetical protein
VLFSTVKAVDKTIRVAVVECGNQECRKVENKSLGIEERGRGIAAFQIGARDSLPIGLFVPVPKSCEFFIRRVVV